MLGGHFQQKSLRLFQPDTSIQASFIAWYNFDRKHEALTGNTPAIASDSRDHVLRTIRELIERAWKYGEFVVKASWSVSDAKFALHG